MQFSELRENLRDLLLSYVDELAYIDENENTIYDEFDGTEETVDGFDCIDHTMEALCDDIGMLMNEAMGEKLFEEQDGCCCKCDPEMCECECQEECECHCDDEGTECCCCCEKEEAEETDEEEVEEEEEDEDDIPFSGMHYIDDEDEMDNYLRELYLLNETVKVYDYDPVKNGIIIDNVNIEPCFGGIQVLGEVTKVDETTNSDGFVTVNVALYEADEFDDSIRVLRKASYDIDLESIDDYSVFDVEIDLDPDTMDRTSGVNVYLTR